MSENSERDIDTLWTKLMEGEPPADESTEITSADVNRQTAARWAR